MEDLGEVDGAVGTDREDIGSGLLPEGLDDRSDGLERDLAQTTVAPEQHRSRHLSAYQDAAVHLLDPDLGVDRPALFDLVDLDLYRTRYADTALRAVASEQIGDLDEE